MCFAAFSFFFLLKTHFQH
jgi:hypothetical protein